MAAEITEDRVDAFWRDGYVIAPSVFTSDEAKQYREAIDAVFEEQVASGEVTNTWDYVLRGDVSTFPAPLWGLVLDPRVTGLAQELLGDRPIYFRDSNIHIGSAFGNWHKDNRVEDRHDPSGLDWQGRYPILRMGVYLQDHSRHSGGLSLRVRSHEARTTVGSLVSKTLGPPLYKRTNKRAFRNTPGGMYALGKPIHVDTQPGDIVIWNLRTTHSGNSLRFRGLPNRKLSPELEMRAPRWATLPYEQKRLAVFLTYGAKSDHFDRYFSYVTGREYFQSVLDTRPHPDFVEAVKTAGVDFIDPSATPQ